MAMFDLPVFQALRQKMQWHQTRQGVLAENIANADTPGYQSQDLKDFKFRSMVQNTVSPSSPVQTDDQHMTLSASSGSPKAQDISSFERTPDGNSVVLEEQMMKVAQNQMDYQMATSLYSRGLGILKTAIKRSA
ncbi:MULTISPECIES: flagellar basal body rod protein FlgB [Pseudovibrio]|uniref:flagellar basal body rod protein FlgB n=1 Tax=Stappiaceae TaxID=2821832 RepID=UPI002365447B|nr:MULTISPECIES: flagellar basal body rod protein FlgB [Pseudovibrio]MDD7910447.1 flagellar basal body rod protein FlgB [Pseudovibrio exalbescens]MDX5594162.1 flagellar basal body rod protein FlgB [Pseudovibrio sp. SPO723]